MINLTLLNKALVDENVSDKEFRTLYLILNNLSMNKTNSLEIYNGYMMDKLNICERQVRNITNGLAEKGYIIKLNCGNSKIKNGNIYQLPKEEIKGEINEEKKLEKNFPPYNNKKENIKDNISLLSTSTKGSRVEETDNLKTDELTDNFSLNEIENKTVSEVEEPKNDQNINTNSDEEMTYYSDEELQAVNAQAINEYQMMCETRYQNTGNKDFKEVSEWVGKKLHRGYDLLKSLRASKTINGVKAYISEIDEIIASYQKVFNTGRLTKKQEQAFLDFESSVDKAIADKQRYFNGGEKTKEPEQTQTVKDEENAKTSTENEDIKKAAPAPVSANNDWNDFMMKAFS